MTVGRHILLLDATRRRRNAGPKARRDTAFFLREVGLQVAPVPTSRSRYWRTLLLAYARLAPISWRSGDTLWTQFPLEAPTQILLRRARRHGASTVAFVHDIEALKHERFDAELFEREVRRLREFDAVVALNRVIGERLRAAGVVADAALGLWDYRCTPPLPAAGRDGAPTPARVAFAGNLSPYKAGFVAHLRELAPVEFELYGDGLPAAISLGANVFHRGSFEPDEPPFVPDGRFGLVWDGPDLDTCRGDFGAYLRVNAPLKASMFLACGLPLLVWKDAAIAGDVVRHGAGLTIGSLRELPARLGALSGDEYRQLAARAEALGEKIRAGHFIQHAARETLAALQARRAAAARPAALA